MFSAEILTLALSVFGPISRRFWLPEQPGAYPEQGDACPERSGNCTGVIPECSRSNSGSLRLGSLYPDKGAI